MANWGSLEDIQERAEQLDSDAIEINEDIWSLGIQNCEQVCGNVRVAIGELIAMLRDASALGIQEDGES